MNNTVWNTKPKAKSPSPGERFRAALDAENPLQVAGVIHAYAAILAEKTGFAEGDVLFFGADKWENVCEVLGRVRLRAAELLKLTTQTRES